MNFPLADFPDAPSLDGHRALAPRFAALAHPARLDILRHLAERDACCCKDIVRRMDLAQSTVSQHLKVLVEAGLVRYQPHRQSSVYSLDREALADLSGALGRLVACCCAPPAPSVAAAPDQDL